MLKIFQGKCRMRLVSECKLRVSECILRVSECILRVSKYPRWIHPVITYRPMCFRNIMRWTVYTTFQWNKVWETNLCSCHQVSVSWESRKQPVTTEMTERERHGFQSSRQCAYIKKFSRPTPTTWNFSRMDLTSYKQPESYDIPKERKYHSYDSK